MNYLESQKRWFVVDTYFYGYNIYKAKLSGYCCGNHKKWNRKSIEVWNTNIVYRHAHVHTLDRKTRFVTLDCIPRIGIFERCYRLVNNNSTTKNLIWTISGEINNVIIGIGSTIAILSHHIVQQWIDSDL